MNKSDFLYASDAQTDEQTIVLTPGQLQMLIKQAIAPLVAEISDLKQRIAELENRLDIKHDLEHDIQREHEIEHDTQDHAALKTDTAEPSGHEIIPYHYRCPWSLDMTSRA
jgi:predicted RNase H-like nuclease (RuvC/YqgF family)